MTIAAWLVAMVGPLAARLLTSFGVTLITLTGAVATVTAFKTQATAAFGALPASAVQLAGLMGAWECVGMWLGTYTFLMTYKATAGFMALAKA